MLVANLEIDRELKLNVVTSLLSQRGYLAVNLISRITPLIVKRLGCHPDPFNVTRGSLVTL
jgi:hypothetical protein